MTRLKENDYLKNTPLTSLAFVRAQAKKAARRDGCARVIIRDFDGLLSFSRRYSGCCPDWYGEIIEEIEC